MMQLYAKKQFMELKKELAKKRLVGTLKGVEHVQSQKNANRKYLEYSSQNDYCQ